MSNPWIRLYRESLHDPKIVTLSDRHHRAWHNCLLIADDTGTLPPLRDVAVHMRLCIPDAEQIVIDLLDAGLLDVDVLSGNRVFRMHGWAKRQYVSDNSTARSHKHRVKRRATDMQRCSDANATPPEPETDSEPESETDKSLLLTPLPPSDRPDGKEQNFIPDLKGEGRKEVGSSRGDLSRRPASHADASGDVRELTRMRAEGLGLPIDEIIATAQACAPKSLDAYVQGICRKRIRARLPAASDDFVRAAFAPDPKAYYALVRLLVMAES